MGNLLSSSTEGYTKNNFKIKLSWLHSPLHSQVQGQWQGSGVINPWCYTELTIVKKEFQTSYLLFTELWACSLPCCIQVSSDELCYFSVLFSLILEVLQQTKYTPGCLNAAVSVCSDFWCICHSPEVQSLSSQIPQSCLAIFLCPNE